MSSSNQNEASEQEIIPFNHGSPSQILRPSFEPQTDETVHHASNFVIIEGGGATNVGKNRGLGKAKGINAGDVYDGNYGPFEFSHKE
ncbi:hypothetical protein CFP56_037419 [Quercus suber]|uniref:Uncharacterized protein n=1 Tax=Quercus suber TaxID=58331 RepID=A0AAW0LPZ7_QUESU